jgi:hypothetical protein
MAVLFVLCDKGLKHGSTIATVLKKCGETLPVSEFSYVVKTELSADQIYDMLRSRIGGGPVWVFTVPEPYTGHAPASVKQWLEEAGNSYVTGRDTTARR